MKYLLVTFALLTQACGPGAKESKTPEPAAERSTIPPVDAGPSPATAPRAARANLSEADCEALFAHVFNVAFTSQQETLPPEQRPNEEDLRNAKDRLRGEILTPCVGATRQSFHYDCAMAAQTPEAMQACMGGE